METLTMTCKEIDKMTAIHGILESRLTWAQAANQLRLSARQIGRLVAKVRLEGARGIIHGLRGRPSNNKIDLRISKRAIDILSKPVYEGFGPTLAQEKLQELHRLDISISALRRRMIAESLWSAKGAKVRHRAWRPRRMCLGEMVQLDASYHDWFEGRGPKCALLSFVDDATSTLRWAQFVQGEDTVTLMASTKAYVLRYGRPVSLYADRHGVYKVNDKYALTEPILRDPHPMTQFGRAMAELGIELIPAFSPQAKGRVERSFRTLQDRLIKEMRLRGISSVEQANRFLEDVFIPFYNKRFGVEAQSPVDVHRPLRSQHNLDSIFSLKTERRIINDFTIRLKGKHFQILKNQSVAIRPKDRVLVELWLDGSIHLKFKNQELAYIPIPKGLDRQKAELQLKFRLPRVIPGPWDSLAAYWRVSRLFESLKLNLEKTGDIQDLEKTIFSTIT